MCPRRTVIPMKLLKELALGNIQPMTRNFKKDSVYAKLLAEVTERQEKLVETLSPEQKTLFDEASQAEIDLSIENDHDLFVKGFSFDLAPYYDAKLGKDFNDYYYFMPSYSNLWNKAQDTVTREINEDWTMDFSVSVLDVDKEHVKFVIEKNA